MTAEERHKILCIFAYNYGEFCKSINKKTDNDNNWKKAEEFLNIDQDVNGEDFLLCMLKESDEE